MKTSELTGAALDWAVAKCEGRPHSYAVVDVKGQPPLKAVTFTPSTDWAQAGPIIERERISLDHLYVARDTGWDVWVAVRVDGPAFSEEQGPTPLVAAMRCFVASQLGDEVDVPDELTQGATA
jgi:Protein of unknown function (DUF2591)